MSIVQKWLKDENWPDIIAHSESSSDYSNLAAAVGAIVERHIGRDASIGVEAVLSSEKCLTISGRTLAQRFNIWHYWCRLFKQILWKSSFNNYESYYHSYLRKKYAWIQAHFRIQLEDQLAFWPINVSNAEETFHQLKTAWEALQLSSSNLDRAALALDLAATNMISVYAPGNLGSIITKEISRLQDSTIADRDRYLGELNKAKKFLEENSTWSPEIMYQYYLTAEEVDRLLNEEDTERQKNNWLQIERLKTFRNWGFGLLLILLAMTPFASKEDVVEIWSNVSFFPSSLSPLIKAWSAPLIMAFLGAAGGFISGLYQARSSGITLAGFQENRIRLWLRLLLG